MKAFAKILAGTGIVTLAVAGAPASAAELITNGGFETGTFSGWTVTGSGTSGVASNAGAGVSPSLQNYRAYFINNSVTIYQDVATVIGQTYSFGFTNEVDSGTPTNAFAAMFGGATIYSQSNVNGMGFTPRTFSVTATSALSRVAFTFTSNGYQNFDNVTLTGPAPSAVPEPASWAMMIAGFGGIGSMMRRRQRVLVRFA